MLCMKRVSLAMLGTTNFLVSITECSSSRFTNTSSKFSAFFTTLLAREWLKHSQPACDSRQDTWQRWRKQLTQLCWAGFYEQHLPQNNSKAGRSRCSILWWKTRLKTPLEAIGLIFSAVSRVRLEGWPSLTDLNSLILEYCYYLDSTFQVCNQHCT